MDASDALPGFPVLTEEYLRSLTFGIYQLKQAKSYSREHTLEKGGYEKYVSQTSPDIIQGKIQSRHVSSKMHYLWIQYDGNDKEDPTCIKYWYCQCKSGARMVGSCAHVASLLWFIGVKRHENDVNSQIIPDNILDRETSSFTDISSASDEYDSSSH